MVFRKGLEDHLEPILSIDRIVIHLPLWRTPGLFRMVFRKGLEDHLEPVLGISRSAIPLEIMFVENSLVGLQDMFISRGPWDHRVFRPLSRDALTQGRPTRGRSTHGSCSTNHQGPFLCIKTRVKVRE